MDFSLGFLCDYNQLYRWYPPSIVDKQKEVKLKKLWRTVFVITIALPQFVTLLAMRSLLSNGGPVNQMLVTIGLMQANEPFEILAFASSPWNAKTTIS